MDIQHYIGEIFGVMLITVLAYISNKIRRFIKNIKSHNIGYNAKLGVKIEEKLIELRAKYDAERAVVFLFHNGNNYLCDMPEIKVSPIYESHKDHVVSLKEKKVILLVSDFPKAFQLIDSIKSDKFILIANHPDATLANLMLDKGYESVFICPLRNRMNQLIGYVQLDFMEKKANEPQDGKILKVYSDQINFLLRNG